ncbi:MAG: permease [Spirochaetaceae bacterium]|nr:permease [Spirochaetaceae bacterium]
MKKKSMLLLWVGASISLAEIFTGGLAAPLGFARGLAAILIGHGIGCGLFALGAYISFYRKQNAMDSVVFSLGRGGGRLVALCNVAQLTGWTLVMIIQAGSALVGLVPDLPFPAAVLFLSACVLAWALLFGSPAGWVNNFVVILLVALCAVLFAEAGGGAVSLSEGGSFALAVELSIIMPVSWLPLVGDYSRKAETTAGAVLMPFLGYFTGSVLMYAFGLYIAIAGGGDIFSFIAQSRFRIPACGVVLFSTLTTAFLDLYSAAVSLTQFVKTKSEKFPILAIGLAAALIAAVFPAESYESFLEGFLVSIGTVFVPVYTVVFLDFLLKKPRAAHAFPPVKIIAALAGMAAYRVFAGLRIEIPTVFCILIVCALYLPFALRGRREPC